MNNLGVCSMVESDKPTPQREPKPKPRPEKPSSEFIKESEYPKTSKKG